MTHRFTDVWSDGCNTPQVEVILPTNGLYMGIHGHMGVKMTAQIPHKAYRLEHSITNQQLLRATINLLLVWTETHQELSFTIVEFELIPGYDNTIAYDSG